MEECRKMGTLLLCVLQQSWFRKQRILWNIFYFHFQFYRYLCGKLQWKQGKFRWLLFWDGKKPLNVKGSCRWNSAKRSEWGCRHGPLSLSWSLKSWESSPPTSISVYGDVFQYNAKLARTKCYFKLVLVFVEMIFSMLAWRLVLQIFFASGR